MALFSINQTQWLHWLAYQLVDAQIRIPAIATNPIPVLVCQFKTNNQIRSNQFVNPQINPRNHQTKRAWTKHIVFYLDGIQYKLTCTMEPSNPAGVSNDQHTESNFDWPNSFIQLLNVLLAKSTNKTNNNQNNNHHQSADDSNNNNNNKIQTTAISNTSSPFFDELDFELINLTSINDDSDGDDHQNPRQQNSLWLSNFSNYILKPQQLQPTVLCVNDDEIDAINSCKKLMICANDDNNNNNIESFYTDLNNNCDANLENLNTLNETPESKQHAEFLTMKCNSDQNVNIELTRSKLTTKLQRCRTLPVRFDNVISIDLKQLKTKIQIPESMLFVQDFDDDDEDDEDDDVATIQNKSIAADIANIDSRENKNIRKASQAETADRSTHHDDNRDHDDENNNSNYTVNKTSSQLDSGSQSSSKNFDQSLCTNDSSLQLSPARTAGSAVLPSSVNPTSSDDGKHSMLQFALYNFREAIDKYSLESQAQRVASDGGCQSDTSTLRGSLKLIEALRGGNNLSSKASEDTVTPTQGKRKQQVAISGSGKQEKATTFGATKGSLADWSWRELADMVKFTKDPIQRSLLKLSSEDLNRRAVDCFGAIMQYMGDLQQPAMVGTLTKKQQQQAPIGEVECVYLILINCHNYPILRDEVYCQLIKQTTNNRSSKTDSCLRGWRLFSIVAAYFNCSDLLKPYLLKYLETAAYDKRRAYCSVALICLQNLRKTFRYNGRKNVPSVEEIAATSAGRNSKRQIYRLPGGTERVINTRSTTVVEDIIQDICTNMLSVSDKDEMLEFSLYCIADGDLYTMPLNRDEYILDITTELTKNHQQYFLIFCRSIWHYPLRLDNRLYIELIFNQIAPDYLEGLLLVLPFLTRNSAGGHQSHQGLRLNSKLVKDIARNAALLHRAAGSEELPPREAIKYLLPKPIVSTMKRLQRTSPGLKGNDCNQHHSSSSSSAVGSDGSTRECSDNCDNLYERGHEQHFEQTNLISVSISKWLELIQANWREIIGAFEPIDAKAQFLDIVRHWPLFGSSFFAVKLIQRDLIPPADFILALNKSGIQMLDLTSHESVHKYPFKEVISTRKVRSEDGTLFLDLKCGNLIKRSIIRIQTDQAHEISRLIRQYIDIELLQQRSTQPKSSAESTQEIN